MTDGFDFSGFEQQMDAEGVIPGVTHVVLTPDMVRKRVMWDVVPCRIGSQVVAKMGMTPASEDVEEMEHHESHERLNAVKDVIPLVLNFSLYAAQAVRGAMMVEHGDEVGEAPLMREDVLGAALYQATLASIAELVDIGALHLPHFPGGSQQ